MRLPLLLRVLVLSLVCLSLPSAAHAADGFAPTELAEADAAAQADGTSRCAHRETGGTNCQEGNNRRVTGSGKKVYGDRWPRLSGLLWIAQSKSKDVTLQGTDESDELLGFGGDDELHGYGGADIIWGNFHPSINPTGQRDLIDGGAGNDWLYTSHGRNTVLGGPGNDFLYAYYGRGTLDCGPGKQDTAKIRLGTGQYKVKNCERILNFCAFGSIDGKRGAKPGEKKAARSRR